MGLGSANLATQHQLVLKNLIIIQRCNFITYIIIVSMNDIVDVHYVSMY